MSKSESQPDALRAADLALAHCVGTLSDTEAAELSSLLAKSDACRLAYWEAIALHTQLDWDLGGQGAARDTVSDRLSDHVGPRHEAHSPATRSATSTSWWFALAAGLLIAVVGGSWPWWSGLDASDSGTAGLVAGAPRLTPVVGTLTAMRPDSTWSLGRTGGSNADELRTGDTLLLEDGAVELRLLSNTVAYLESPAIMQIVSVDRVRMMKGGVKVEVAKGAEGFAVETDAAEVIDLGTVFSVSVADGATDLVVFDGEVDLKLSPLEPNGDVRSANLTKRFRAGEAVQVAKDGTLSRIVNVQQSSLQNLGIDNLHEPVIAEVKDNYVREDFYSFYEIVPSGMQEDANAFVDRPLHEWNGYHSTGMPAYLVGGDYVKTFNDDKVIEDLRIDVALSRPATLYVLLDQRVSPPAWLQESFTDTGDVIGLDEVPYYPEDPSRLRRDRLGVGPGKSIDRTHSIWKKTVTHAGLVSLGANGELIEAPPEGVMSKASMFGLVAVPLGSDI